MYEFAEMAGLLAAHGIWSVSDGAVLIPLLGYEQANGDKVMSRLVHDDLGDAAAAGRAALEANDTHMRRAALVVDGYVHLESGRTDALIVEAVDYEPERRSLVMAVPYRPLDHPGGFAVHRPKILELRGIPHSASPAVAAAFFAGVDGHTEANAVWNAHLDESI